MSSFPSKDPSGGDKVRPSMGIHADSACTHTMRSGRSSSSINEKWSSGLKMPLKSGALLLPTHHRKSA